MKKEQVIAIDGPSGSGKSTIAKKLSHQLGIIYIDTGAMFRSLGLYFSQFNIDFSKDSLTENEINILNEKMKTLDFQYGVSDEILVQISGEDWTHKIREHHVSALASNISKHEVIRDYIKDLEREIVAQRWAILDGRDIGTVVFPNAVLKVYLTATAQVRGERRFNQLKNKGSHVSLENIISDIEKRDYQDMNRDVAPLKQADDALFIDSSTLSIDDVVEKILIAFKKVKND